MVDEVGARATVSEGAVGGDFEPPGLTPVKPASGLAAFDICNLKRKSRCRPAAGAAGCHKPNNPTWQALWNPAQNEPVFLTGISEERLQLPRIRIIACHQQPYRGVVEKFRQCGLVETRVGVPTWFSECAHQTSRSSSSVDRAQCFKSSQNA
jgi:hypothetical protein